MAEHRPAREALKGMEIAIPPGQDLPPQQSPGMYAQRPLPPIPLKSPARGSIRANASSHQHGRPPPRSPARPQTSQHPVPPAEYWKLPHSDLAYSNKPLPPPIVTGSRHSGDRYQLDPLPDPPFIRKKSWSVGGVKADSDLTSHFMTPKSPTLAPTLHNSPDKIRQLIGHDVNINSDTSHSRVRSDPYDSTTYTAPASPASSSCYSNDTIDTTVSEPAPPAPGDEGQEVTEYDKYPGRALVAEGFNFIPSPKSLPDSPLSAHVDPLIVRRRAEVISGEIRLDPAIHGLSQPPGRPNSCQSLDPRRASVSGAAPKKEKGEDYVVKNLYHATTAHIAASTKRRETQEYPPSSPPSSTPWTPVSQAMGRLGFSPRHLTSQQRTSRIAGLPFSASAFEVGDRPLRTPFPVSPPTSTFDIDDDHRSYMSRVFRRSNSSEESSPVSHEIRGPHAGARAGLQGLVSQARRSAGLLTRSEKRQASLRHKIRVVPEGDGV